MSSIPTTSKNSKIPYTVISGGEKIQSKKVFDKISLIVLNRGRTIYKTDFFKELEHLGFSEIISIENPCATYDIENLSKKYPYIRFFLLQKSGSPGEQINIGMEEALGEFVYVLWNDMKLSPSSVSLRLFEIMNNEKPLCVVPVFRTLGNDLVPSISVPVFKKRLLKIINTIPKKNGVKTLFPFDYTGIYNRSKFLITGGYDYSILNPYWQKMDFGVRSNMWGEEIICNTSLHVSYTTDFATEDTTIDKNYRLFYLKNLAVRFNGDSGYLPSSGFLKYLFQAGEDFFSAKRNFKAAREWVELNKYRFKHDCRSLTELWADPEE